MAHTEKRRYDRVPFAVGLTVVDVVTRQTREASSIDLSGSGLQFYADRFLAVGTRVCIRFRLRGPQRAAPVELGATVRWARVEQDGAIMGAEFDAPLGPDYCPALYEELFALP